MKSPRVLGWVMALLLIPLALTWFASRILPVDSDKRLQPPELLTKKAVDLDEYRRDMRSVLQSYGWVDREQGIVHVPMDAAIEVLLKRGLPARAETESVPVEDR